MKKLWIVNQYTVTPEYPASTRHYELAKFMADRFDVTVWGSNFIHHNKTFRSTRRWVAFEELMEGFRLVWLPALAYKGNGIMRTTNMLLYALVLFIAGVIRADKPDVILGSSPPLFAAYSSMWVAKVRGAKFILEIRDLWPDSLTEITGKEGGFIVRMLRYLERSLYRNADCVIALTEGIEEAVRSRGVDPEKMFFLPNGIDLQSTELGLDAADRHQMRARIGIDADDFVFMYAGAHGPANDLDQLLDAAVALKEHTRIKLVLIGEGVEKERLRSSAAQRGLNNVLFLSAVPKSEIQSYLSCADAFIICLKNIPLYNGALPNKLFDYMLQDKPIISTVPGELKRFLEGKGLGKYGSMRELSDRYLPRLMLDIAHGTKITPAAAGSELVKSVYSRRAQSEALAETIQQIIEAKQRGSE